MIKEIETVEYLQDFIFYAENLAIVDFYADWCAPCKALTPVLEQLNEEHDISIYKVNADRVTLATDEFNVRGLPTLIFYDGGEEVYRTSGSTTKGQLSSLIKRYSKEDTSE